MIIEDRFNKEIDISISTKNTNPVIASPRNSLINMMKKYTQ